MSDVSRKLVQIFFASSALKVSQVNSVHTGLVEMRGTTGPSPGGGCSSPPIAA